MKKNIIMALFVLFSYEIEAQESKTVYNFLRLPVSAHAAALGGENISIDDDDPTLVILRWQVMSPTARSTSTI
jgi:hypothetical protein